MTGTAGDPAPGLAGWWRAASLQRKFFVVAGALMVVTSALFLLLVATLYRGQILAANERASLTVNRLLQAALENAMVKRDIGGLQQIVEDLGAQEGIAGVMIANPDGEIRFSSYPERLYEKVADPDFAGALESRTQRTGFRTLADGVQVLRSINPVLNQPRCRECHGAAGAHPVNGLLIVDYDSTGVSGAVLRGAGMLGALGLLVLFAVEAGLWAALRRAVLDRLQRLDAALRRIAEGDLSARTDDPGGDEISRLAADFNTTAGRLERAVGDLKASQRQLQALIDAVPDGVRVIDGAFRTRMVNRSFAAQLGLSPAEALARPCHAVSHGRAQPCVATMVRCPVAEILHGGPDHPDHLRTRQRHRRADGAELSVEVSAVPVRLSIDGQEIDCVVESVRDLEAELGVSQEERLSELGLLAAGVAHEVNNPLSSIGLALGAIGREEGLSERARSYLAIAETETVNCLGFTESLLKLAAKPQGGRDLIEVGDVIRGTVALLGFEAERRRAELKAEVTGRPRVLGADANLRMLVFNLVLNAIHAMPAGGSVTIACAAEGPSLRLTVADTGVGIAEADRDKIMLPFWTRRADGTRGRGLGLAVCKSIVDGLGGSIGFESEPGRGTTFTVILPNADWTPS